MAQAFFNCPASISPDNIWQGLLETAGTQGTFAEQGQETDSCIPVEKQNPRVVQVDMGSGHSFESIRYISILNPKQLGTFLHQTNFTTCLFFFSKIHYVTVPVLLT